MKKIKFLSFIIFLSFLSFSCQQKEKNHPENEKLKVISSFSILTDILKEVGKDSIEIHNLVPTGTDPHEYSPTPEDIKFATKADLFVYNGLNLEGGNQGWFFKLFHSTQSDEKKLIKVAENVKPLYLSGKEKEVNPHSFISPVVGIEMAKSIANALISSDEKNADFYKENLTTYLEKLIKIEQKYQIEFSKIPIENRVFVSSEQAFQYLTTEYNLKEGFIWAVDTEENGSPDQIKKTIAFVKENKPPVLFVESNVDIRPMETVSKETETPIYQPAIFSDELGKPGAEADTYLKYLLYNLKHISQGLQ